MNDTNVAETFDNDDRTKFNVLAQIISFEFHLIQRDLSCLLHSLNFFFVFVVALCLKIFTQESKKVKRQERANKNIC